MSVYKVLSSNSGTYYSLTYLADVVHETNSTVEQTKREVFNFYVEPIADIVQVSTHS